MSWSLIGLQQIWDAFFADLLWRKGISANSPVTLRHWSITLLCKFYFLWRLLSTVPGHWFPAKVIKRQPPGPQIYCSFQSFVFTLHKMGKRRRKRKYRRGDSGGRWRRGTIVKWWWRKKEARRRKRREDKENRVVVAVVQSECEWVRVGKKYTKTFCFALGRPSFPWISYYAHFASQPTGTTDNKCDVKWNMDNYATIQWF